MRILAVEIKNFKSIKHLVIPSNHLTILYGPNGAGKTNIIQALNMLFQPEAYPDDFKNQPDDFGLAFYLELEGFEH